MTHLTFILPAILIGLGATLTFDLWAWLARRIFKIPPSNLCFVGRWLLYMPAGKFTHPNIGSSPPKRAECLVGLLAHYLIGVAFSVTFIALVGSGWLFHPTLLPALAFGIVTVLAPFFIMQPAFGFGIAASKTKNPAQARLRSILNHAAFGFGLFFFAGLLARFF